MIDQKIRNRYGDVVFVNETSPVGMVSADMAAMAGGATTTQIAEDFLRENIAELGLAESSFQGDASLAGAAADGASGPVICYSHQKEVGDTSVVVYDQFVMDLPIFDARIGVQVDELVKAVSAAQSSMHSHVEVANPEARKSLDEPKPVSDRALQKALGISLKDMSDGRINRQVVYRYESDKRVEEPVDEHPGCFAGHAPYTLDLPALPEKIQDGTHYVANEYLFRAARPDEPPVNWRALVEPESGALLYIRALVANATGKVFVRDPQVQTGAVVTGASTNAQLNPFASSETLAGIAPASPQPLVGEYVRLAETSAPAIAGPLEIPPAPFNYNAATDHFAAVNAYYHCDKLFRTMKDYGFNVFSYFGGTSFPVPVDHCALGNAVNAQAPGNATGTGLGELRFGRVMAGQPVGMATANGVVWHEFGHGLLWDHVNSPNFGFAHSAGDALACILNDPGSQALDRFMTFPWVTAGTPGIDRRHDRAVSAGWAWFGPQYNTQYNGEQILSTTLFRLYRSIGGDALGSLSTQTRAAQTTAYLIFKGIGLLSSTTQFPEVFVTNLQNADLNTGNFKGIPGGALHKVVRWAFEKQGLFQAAAAPGQGNTVNGVGNPPNVDVYINDGRNGEYPYQSNHWSCQDMWVRRAADAGATHQEPVVGQTNYMYVRVKNRGLQAANGVHVDAYHAFPGSGLTFPDDWMAMDTPTLPAGAPIAPGGQTVVGPFAFIAQQVGHECLLAIAHANGDNGNDTTITGSIPEHRFVPFDNNIGQRNVHPVFPKPYEIMERFRRHLLLVRNPFKKPVVCDIRLQLPRFLGRLGWKMRVASAGGTRFELGPRGRREVILSIQPGEDFSADIAKRAIAQNDNQIQLQTYLDGELVGGMSYVLSFDAESGERVDPDKKPEPEKAPEREAEPGRLPDRRSPRLTVEEILKAVRGGAGAGAGLPGLDRPVRTIRFELDLDD